MQSTDSQLPSADMLFEHAACGLLVTDADGRILRVNATFCGWLGYSSVELATAKRIQDLLTAGGKVFYQTHWAPLLQMQGSVAEVKLNMMHRDGHLAKSATWKWPCWSSRIATSTSRNCCSRAAMRKHLSPRINSRRKSCRKAVTC
jgi:PAS domain-containing protein